MRCYVNGTIQLELDYSESRNKPKQKQAISSLLEGQDVMAVLPTGLGKSLIFTVFGTAVTEKLAGRSASLVVICPLKRVILDQIAELEGLCSAAEHTPDCLPKILVDTPVFVYTSAEKTLEERFLAKYFEQEPIQRSILYFGWLNKKTSLLQNVYILVINEC